jgi:Leucine Rich repeat
MPYLGQLSLEELELAENEITDEGLAHLYKLKHLKKVDVDYRDRRKPILERLIGR